MKTIVGRLDNSRYTNATPSIQITLFTPARAKQHVPVMVSMGVGFAGFENARLFASAPGKPVSPAPNTTAGSAKSPNRAAAGLPPAPSALLQVLSNGWAYATVNPSAIQADSGAGFTAGIIGLVNAGRPRQPDDWGVLAAWAWGLSRALDYLETDRSVDAKRAAITGHSRWGKTALLAAALDPRWAIVYCSGSGEGGAKPHRHDLGECVDNLCSLSEYHWMAGNFLKYGGQWERLPVDQHELIALCAPRPVLVTTGTQDFWSDPVGEFQACVAAGPVYRLLGQKDLGTTAMPAPDVSLITGELAYRLHTGGHTDVIDWPVFLQFAHRYFDRE